MERSLYDLPVAAPLPSGFVIRAVASDDEAPRRAAVQMRESVRFRTQYTPTQ